MDHEDKTQAHLALTSGIRIAHYRVVNKIGEGGMGKVYMVEDSYLVVMWP